MRNVLVCVCIIIGTIIGAGFASGQEIISFFNRFGECGFYGILLACALFGVVSIVVICLVKKNHISSYKELVNGNQFITIFMEVFSFVCFCIMLAGIGAFIQEMFDLPYFVCSIIAGLICALMLLMKFSGMEKINSILVPLIIIGILLLGVKQYDSSDFQWSGDYIVPPSFTNSWIASSVLYASYNTLILLPVLTNFESYKLSKFQIFIVGITISVFLSIMALIIYNICDVFYPQIMSVELPTLRLAMMNGKFVSVFYSVVILASILTTAFSTGYSFLCMKNIKNYNRNVITICVFAVIFSGIGFSNLINTLFPLFGYLGILQIVLVLIMQIKKGYNRKG
mgnify:FL=1